MSEERFAAAREELTADLRAKIKPVRRITLNRGDLAKIVDAAVQAYCLRHAIAAYPPVLRDFTTDIMETLIGGSSIR